MKDLIGNTFVVGNFAVFADSFGFMKIGKIINISLADVTIKINDEIGLVIMYNKLPNEVLCVYGNNLNDEIAQQFNLRNNDE